VSSPTSPVETQIDNLELSQSMQLLLPNIWNLLALRITRKSEHVIAQFRFSAELGNLKVQGITLCDEKGKVSCDIPEELHALALQVVSDYQQSKKQLKTNFLVTKASQNMEWNRILLAKACTAFFKDVCEGIHVRRSITPASQSTSSGVENDESDEEMEEKHTVDVDKMNKQNARKPITVANSQCTPISDDTLPIMEPKVDIL
jgi:hypothetical protein